jgi:hypothetical protein
MRGASRSSRTRGEMRWTQMARWTLRAVRVRRSRVVLMSRCWHEVAWSFPRSDGGKRAVLRGEHEVSRKAIAQGRPECFRCTCMLVCVFPYAQRHTRPRVQQAPGLPCALVSRKSVRMCERAVAHQPPVAGTEPVAPKGDRACVRARDSSGVFLNPNSCKGFEPEPSKEGSG